MRVAPTLGLVFWLETNSAQTASRLWRANLDGSDTRVVLDEYAWDESPTHCHENNKAGWASSKRLRRPITRLQRLVFCITRQGRWAEHASRALMCARSEQETGRASSGGGCGGR